MTAKEYLSQLELLSQRIRHKKQELRDEKLNLGISVTGEKGERVQTSFAGAAEGNRTESQAMRLMSLETEIGEQIVEYMEECHKIIDQIHDLHDSIYIDILYRRYVKQERDFTKLAFAMGYSYKYVINKHGEALMEFERVHPEILELKCEKL